MTTGARSRTYPPGQSPFHAKGSIWEGIREFVTECVPGGTEAVDGKLDPETRAFFSQKFVIAGWYDILPVVNVANAVAATLGVPVTESLRRSAVWHAERDLKGIYASVLKFDSPEAVCRRFASIFALHYSFGRAQIVGEEPRRMVACAYGIPESIAAWWMRASECYVVPVLESAGAKNPRLVWGNVESDGERLGVQLVRCPSSTEWD